VRGESEKVPFSFEGKHNRVGIDRCSYRCILSVKLNDCRAILNTDGQAVLLNRDRFVRLRLGGRGFLLRASPGCLSQHELEIEHIDAPVAIDIATTVGTRTLEYFGDDDLNVLNVDPVVAVGIAEGDVMPPGVDKRHADDGEDS
jgi:hypothetical protein